MEENLKAKLIEFNKRIQVGEMSEYGDFEAIPKEQVAPLLDELFPDGKPYREVMRNSNKLTEWRWLDDCFVIRTEDTLPIVGKDDHYKVILSHVGHRSNTSYAGPYLYEYWRDQGPQPWDCRGWDWERFENYISKFADYEPNQQDIEGFIQYVTPSIFMALNEELRNNEALQNLVLDVTIYECKREYASDRNFTCRGNQELLEHYEKYVRRDFLMNRFLQKTQTIGMDWESRPEQQIEVLHRLLPGNATGPTKGPAR